MSLKVINIIEEGRYGGPQARIAGVAARLSVVGIETTVICPLQDSNVFVAQLKAKGVRLLVIRIHRLTAQLNHLIGFILSFIPEIFRLAKMLQKTPSDIVHCNGCWQLKGLIAAKLAGSEAKIVYHLNDTETIPGLKGVFSFMAKHWVDGFIATCGKSKEYYLRDKRLQSKPHIVIQAPVDTAVFNPARVTPDPKVAKLPGFKILTVCNINPTKGLDVFIEMGHLLSMRFSCQDLSFIVVGPVYRSQERYFEWLKMKVKEKGMRNVYFAGASNNVPGVLKAADIFVCTSRSESGPMTLWEAMSMGKPVVSTAVGDVEIYLNEGNRGFCVPVDDIEALAKRVAWFIDNEYLRELFGANARSFAIENLDVRLCAEKHALFYKRIVLGNSIQRAGTPHEHIVRDPPKIKPRQAENFLRVFWEQARTFLA